MTEAAILRGRVALVTGAGGGSGAAIAEESARAGADVLVHDLRSDAAVPGGEADAVGGDVSDPTDVWGGWIVR